jgi:mono/diheme cytochrome c family protein
MLRIALALLTASVVASAAMADDPQITRGKYLVTFGGCNDCHTPGYFLGKPGPNITPDKETGIGNWTREQIVTAIQTGQRPDGRILAPIMPWHALAQLTADDAMAIAAFLQSLNPVSHQVPGPFGPGEKVSTFMFRIMPPGEIAAAAAQ